ncbi:ribulose-phosphate 3-epimerase [Williamsoniiplasma lucivorax]|uniref:Ribulose-phosphate 3-epimerase n=1 Tax=Williamsoniiplasma lucivorax TaxID=209274 RepID=A0A2S5RFQ8_9MOLU|nr:ribulose-phosphate 3-epimerase [Williamsoniiplasma lucivorax]PPE06169.1 ribulose-phosphate 3-epimerase [Williamsoniiplasma lucivorax]
MKKIEIAPSLLSADFYNLKADLQRCQENKIQWLHYDVMDYDFVPNLTFGAKILQDLTSQTNFKIDIHFMVKVKSKNFTDFFTEYLQTKPAMMTMHLEAMSKKETYQFIDLCKQNHILASLALKPGTKIKAILPFLPLLDNVLVMTVEPGFGGQKFIPEAAQKIHDLKMLASEHNYHYTVEVDGGINEQTFQVVKKHKVDMAVAGSYLFGQKDFSERLEKLK